MRSRNTRGEGADEAEAIDSIASGLVDMEDSARIVSAFEKVLERNRGRLAAPESDLPAPRDRVRQALLANAEAEAQAGEVPMKRKEFYKAALLELEAFVSDTNARFVNDYQDAKAAGEQWPPEDRARAEGVLRKIQSRQAEAINTWIRPDDLEHTPTLIAVQEAPIVIGKARQSLDAVAVAQEFQGAIWIMSLLDLGALVAAFIIRHARDQPALWVVCLYALPIVLVGGPVWMALGVRYVLGLAARLEKPGRIGRAIAKALVLGIGIAVPPAAIILPTLYSSATASTASLSIASGRCKFDLQAAVTRGPDVGFSIAGQVRLTVTSAGAVSGVLVEHNGTHVPVSGSRTPQAQELALILDLSGGKEIVGVLAPFVGCRDVAAAAGMFDGPGAKNEGTYTQYTDSGQWSLIPAR